MNEFAREHLKERIRMIRKRENIFQDSIPVETSRYGTQYLDSATTYMVVCYPEEIDKIHEELDQEDREAEYEIGRQAEIKREREVNGPKETDFLSFEYWFG